MSDLVYRGRAWVFGDNVALDGDIMPLEFAISRETRPEVLSAHVLKAIDPEFPNKAKPGDVIVAGRRFAQGNPHIQGFLGFRALGLGVVVESIARSSFRLAISAGVPILPACAGVTKGTATGDEVEVDFATGLFRNRTRSVKHSYQPLDRILLTMIANGGWLPSVKKRLTAMGAA
ncbi:MAG: 3-isopropylmalate dehydratase [Alphaproteobacteria bacterium]|nr:3-isopropylmalate dehydratase [Alphaproteobacteria bacterium]